MGYIVRVNARFIVAGIVLCMLASSVTSRSSGQKVERKERTVKRMDRRANIVFVLTDDQDYDLGSMSFMPKTLRYLRDGGAHFPNAFVTTPMCCPSRSSMLTGMYAHNHYIFTNNENCSNVEWQQKFEINSFGRYLSDAGYRTGYFGKYLNDYQGTYIPPGWTEWVGLIRNTRYYNYTLNFNGEKIKHGFDYHKDYLTDLIANDSVTFLKQSKQYFPNRPVAMVLSMPAPHGPEDSAPQYQHLFNNITSYRTPSWNYAPNPDKQWLLQNTGKMEPIHIAFTDMLQQKRLQTLQSVDDAVEKVINELEELGELDNTYFVYSSDHGYHLGQYGLVKGKAMPYEFDIRVPFYIRGPKIPAGTRVANIALNVDLAPTFLDIAGIETPDHMDGKSLLKLFEDPEVGPSGILKRKKAWRDTFLVERGKVTSKKIKQRERLEADKNANHFPSKEKRLKQECEKAEYQPPCSAKQEWECRQKPDGMLRMYKCRQKNTYEKSLGDQPGVVCNCPENNSGVLVPSKKEKRQQKQFLFQHVNQPGMLKTKFIKSRYRRSSSQQFVDRITDSTTSQALLNRGGNVICQVVNNEVVCKPEVYRDPNQWNEQKDLLNDNIQQLKEKLESLRDIKKHLKDKKPSGGSKALDINDNNDHRNDHTKENTSITEINSGPFVNNYGENSYDESPFTSASVTSNTNTDKSSHTNPAFQHSYNTPLENRKNDARESQTLDTGYNSYEDSQEEFEERDSETDYDDGIPSIGEFDPKEFQDEDDRRKVESEAKENMECICDKTIMMSDQAVALSQIKKAEKFEQKRDRKIMNRIRKREKIEERERKREEKHELREKNRQIRKGKRKNSNKGMIDPTRDCYSGNMKCFEHNNDHWKTAPLWNKKNKGFGARKDPMCSRNGLECTRMDNKHWRVQPYWTLGPFCFCPNSNNNTYSCLRTINDTHNFIYCEFITGFISYYDFNNDPYQLRNAVRDLNYPTLSELHEKLDKLKSCKGAQCTERTRPSNSSNQKYKKNRKKVADLRKKTSFNNSTHKHEQSKKSRLRYRFGHRKW